jgi:hypothetical protein
VQHDGGHALSCPDFAADRMTTTTRGRPNLPLMDVPNLVTGVGLAAIALCGGGIAVAILRRAARGDLPVTLRGAPLAEPRLTGLIILLTSSALAVMAVDRVLLVSAVEITLTSVAVVGCLGASVVLVVVRDRRFARAISNERSANEQGDAAP